MDLKEALLEEHSKKQCTAIVEYIGNDKKKFAVLMNLFLHGEYRITQRAGWPLGYSVINHPSLIEPYYKQIIQLLEKPGVHNAVTRNIVRLLEEVDIPKKYHGKIMSICFNFIESNDTPVAVKAYSLTILQKLSKIYPEIKQELQLIVEDRWAHESAAFKSRAKKLIKKELE